MQECRRDLDGNTNKGWGVGPGRMASVRGPGKGLLQEAPWCEPFLFLTSSGLCWWSSKWQVARSLGEYIKNACSGSQPQ